MGVERLKSLKRGVLAMRKMLREMESELEKEIAECAKSGRLEPDAEKVLEVSKSVIGLLNKCTGKEFRPDSKTTLALVRERLADGFSEEMMILAVDEMCYCWGQDQERRMWLRPETLLGEHFESYLQAAICRKRSAIDGKAMEKIAIERMQGGI